MYSLILMTAMSAAPEAPQFNGFFRNLFSLHGCDGGCNGCYGSGASRSAGCFGSSCHGFGSRLRAFFDGGSCYGSCSGRAAGCFGASYSCHGSGYGCAGGFAPGPAFVPGPGPGPGPGMEFAPPAPAISGDPFPGSSSSFGYSLGVPTPIGNPFPIAPAGGFSPAPPVAAAPEDRNAQRPSVPTSAGPTARATVVVRLPADAKLLAEGRPLAQTSGERRFVTPPLPAGRDFEYSFKAEYVRDGETIAQSRTVLVKAGGTAVVEFADLGQGRGMKTSAETTRKPEPLPLTATPVSAAKLPAGPARPTAVGDRARITVKLPPGAVLYVDGKKNERTEAVREFSTPPLNPGQEYAYLMKAETTRDGRPESQTTKVTFRAGEIVSVDFTAAPKQ